MQIQQSPWNRRAEVSFHQVRAGFCTSDSLVLLPGLPRASCLQISLKKVRPLWRGHRRTGQCMDSRCSSSPRQDPSAAASAPSHPQSNESSGGQKTTGPFTVRSLHSFPFCSVGLSPNTGLAGSFEVTYHKAENQLRWAPALACGEAPSRPWSGLWVCGPSCWQSHRPRGRSPQGP